MSAYRGHLTTVVGDGPEVVIKLSGDSVRVLTPDGRVHTWPSRDVRVTGISGDRFWIAFQGEIAVFAPEEPEAFMLEFLPGLKAARTVADAIEAAQDREEAQTPSHVDRIAANGASEVRIAERKPRLPQLSERAAANGRPGEPVPVAQESQADLDAEPDADRRRWWSRGQPAPPLVSTDESEAPRAQPESTDGPEGITVDLTEETLGATLSAAVAKAETTDTVDPLAEGDPEPAAPQSSLLRDLAHRKQAFDANRRGTYQPRR